MELRQADKGCIDHYSSHDLRRKGYIGEGGSKPGKHFGTIPAIPIGFAVSASPMPFSLVTFLHGCKKVTPIDYAIHETNRRMLKYARTGTALWLCLSTALCAELLQESAQQTADQLFAVFPANAVDGGLGNLHDGIILDALFPLLGLLLFLLLLSLAPV